MQDRDGEVVEQQPGAGPHTHGLQDEGLGQPHGLPGLDGEEGAAVGGGPPARAWAALHDTASGRAGAAVAPIILLAVLLLGSGLAWASSRQRMMVQQQQLLEARLLALDAAGQHTQQQLGQLQLVQNQVQSQVAAAAAALANLQQAHASLEALLDPEATASRLNELQATVAQLQLVLSAAAEGASITSCSSRDQRTANYTLQATKAPAPSSTPLAAAPAPPPESLAQQQEQQAEEGRRMDRELVQKEVTAALALFAADRTGLPDYALAAAGAKVVGHSPTLPPSLMSQLSAAGLVGRLGPLVSTSGHKVHPRASSVSVGCWLLACCAFPG